MGLLLGVHVSPADVTDREGAKPLLLALTVRFPRMALIWADQGYDGAPFAAWVAEHAGVKLEISTHVKPALWINESEPPLPPPPPRKGFVVLPHRWVVERTHAWGGRNRRLSKDYEGLASSEEAFICMGMVFLMLKRLS